MSHHNHEPIYNQDDMDTVLARLRVAQKEADHSKQLLWAVVQAAGGEVAIPHSYWLEGETSRDLLMWDDPVAFVMRLKTQEASDV
jgi:hypothetical protein